MFGNSNGVRSSYESLPINTSRERMEYSDFPMPKSYPDFPHHTHVAEYFESYVERFDLKRHIRISTAVSRVVPRDGGGWVLTLEDGTVEEYDALVVANGHHWDPRWPEPAFLGASDFPGRQLHTHDFKATPGWRTSASSSSAWANSAMDIAVEASWVGQAVYLAARTPVHVIPTYVFGRPVDQIESPLAARTLP